MEYYVSYLKDVLGNNYLGLNISNSEVDIYLDELKTILKDEFDEYMDFKNKRDNNLFHLTLINVMECNDIIRTEGIQKFVKTIEETIFTFPIDDLEMIGIGTASKNDNTTYFIVCNSNKLDAIRQRFNLEKRDLHITLAFNKKDVFGVKKDESSLI